ncbi:MAG TPA: FAD-binding oxidoreductase, partial [Polyangiaceae bacterium]|nr:FAD-binding oxidoreductase [Polyangiaceae bacterium]
RQGGYVFLARTREQAQRLQQSIELQRRCGLVTRWLEPKRLTRVVPELRLQGVLGASFNPYDAVVFPWPFVWGYAEHAQALGVEVCPFTRVIGIETRGRSITKVHTERGAIRTHVLVNAAGAHSPSIAKFVGIELPTEPHRHEICSSESLKPWLTPLVADLSNGLYFSQSTRGEIVGGVSNPHVQSGDGQHSSSTFLALYARALLRVCPLLGAVKVLRQWAGLYDVSPDKNPVLGPVDELDGFFLASGFMGHGFMMAPVIGKLLAEHIAKGTRLPLLDLWNLRRFKQGRLLDEGLTIG